MKIGIDALGFENDPILAVDACVDFVAKNTDVEFVIIANQDVINRTKNYNLNKITFVQTEEFANQHDDVSIIRKSKNLSIQIACDLLNENKIDALFSACNTAIFVTTTFIKIGTLDKINKFAFLTTLPTVVQDKYVYLLDSGANKNVTGFDLYQFALMANIYVSKTQNLSNPRIGLINIGTEETKGFDEHKQANALLKTNNSLNYIGFVETRNIINNESADIFICNGYTGNIVLKTLEGSMKTIARFLKTEYKKWFNSFAYLTNKHIINKMIDRFDYKTRAGAFLLGLKKPVIKGHGSSDYKQITSCIKMMYDALKNNVFTIINDKINNMDMKK